MKNPSRSAAATAAGLAPGTSSLRAAADVWETSRHTWLSARWTTGAADARPGWLPTQGEASQPADRALHVEA